MLNDDIVLTRRSLLAGAATVFAAGMLALSGCGAQTAPTDGPREEAAEGPSEGDSLPMVDSAEPVPVATTPFGGENFTFTCNGSSVRLPCTYGELLSATGMEPLEEYGCDPNDQVGDALYSLVRIPGYEDDVNVLFSAKGCSVYGECMVYEVGIDWQDWDDEAELSSYEFPCGLKLGMSFDEACSRYGEPDVSREALDWLGQWVDGDCRIDAMFYNDRGGWNYALHVDL